MSTLSIPFRTPALLLASALLLAACSSTPLEKAPVTQASPVAPAPAAKPPAASTVAPVTATSSSRDIAGPAGTARIVYFDYDSSSIRPEFRALLDAHARFLTTHKDRKLTIGGHTDERGGHEYNLALGQQRADAVEHALELLGVPASQVETVSFGMEKPAVEGHDESAWSRNRRAELAYK
jgi:peptidoglycan-associated lipoprotein